MPQWGQGKGRFCVDTPEATGTEAKTPTEGWQRWEGAASPASASSAYTDSRLRVTPLRLSHCGEVFRASSCGLSALRARRGGPSATIQVYFLTTPARRRRRRAVPLVGGRGVGESARVEHIRRPRQSWAGPGWGPLLASTVPRGEIHPLPLGR